MARATKWLAENPTPYAYVLPQAKVRDSDQLQQELKRIESLGGEGLIVRRPGTYYKDGRTAKIPKVKNHQDAEARVLAHLPGKGRNQGRLGALLVALDDVTQFKTAVASATRSEKIHRRLVKLSHLSIMGNIRQVSPGSHRSCVFAEIEIYRDQQRE